MGQRVKRSGGKRPDDLNSNAQHRVRSHRAMRDDPGVGGFALKLLGDQRDVLILDTHCEKSRNVYMVELLRQARPLLELLERGGIDTGERHELQGNRFIRTNIDSFVINRGPGPADLVR